MQSRKAVDGTRAPKKGWLPVEVTADNIALLTPECKKAYNELPRTYFIKLGTPVTYYGTDFKRNSYIKSTIPTGTTMVIVAKKDDYITAIYNGKIVTVGRNSQHEFFEKVL